MLPMSGGNVVVSGLLSFYQQDSSSPVILTGTLTGFTTSGLHGFHVHEFGGISDNCNAAGLHLNPLNMTHAGPTSAIRHEGDLGNINVAGGSSTVSITDSVITLYGGYSIIGRAMVVHANPDDLVSQPTGAAGGRVGCCTIGSMSPMNAASRNIGSHSYLLPIIAVVSVLLVCF